MECRRVELGRAHGGDIRLVDGTIGATSRLTIRTRAVDLRTRREPASAWAGAGGVMAWLGVQVGFARLAPLNSAQLGQVRVAVPSTSLTSQQNKARLPGTRPGHDEKSPHPGLPCLARAEPIGMPAFRASAGPGHLPRDAQGARS